MKEKYFEFMEKMYSKMQNGFKELREGQDKLEKDVETLGIQIAKIENNLTPKVEAALDGYKVIYDKLEILENKVDKLAATVESHDNEIKVIRGGK